MSFNIECNSCGATSGPSVGICPFCKSVMVNKNFKGSPTISKLKTMYNDGDIAGALSLFRQSERSQTKLTHNLNFILLGVKILLELEGGESNIRRLINNGLMTDPEHAELNDYLEILNAKALMTEILNDEGEQQLLAVIRRSPQNYHALFTLGAHQFWVDGVSSTAIRYLERCVKIRPQFLRAWGCLGAIYEEFENPNLAARAYRNCIKLESDAKMKAFFKQKVKELK